MDDREDLRRRVASIYSTYAPDKLGQVEEVIDRHRDNPYGLLDALRIKYGPEPGGPEPAGGGAPRERAGTTMGGGRTVTMAPGAAGAGHPRSASVASASGGSDDEIANLRRMVSDSGFLTADHARRWEEAWLGKIPLATVCKDQNEILIEAYGYKHTALTKASMFSKWQKRYFVVIPPFVYYFEKDDMASPCRGVIYLPRADVTETEADGRLAIEIQSRVLRKPSAKDGSMDYSAFVIRFDADRQQQVWLQALKKLSTITAKKVIAEKQQQRRERAASAAAIREGAAMARYGGPSYGTASPYTGGPGAAGSPPRYGGAAAANSPLGAAQSAGTETPKKAELPIKRHELNARIRRIASERDPASALEAALDWAEQEVADTLILWKLMEKIEMAQRPDPNANNASVALSQSAASPNLAGSLSGADDIVRAASFIVQQHQAQQQQRGLAAGASSSFAGQAMNPAEALSAPPLPPVTGSTEAEEGGEPAPDAANSTTAVPPTSAMTPPPSAAPGGFQNANPASFAREESSALLASEFTQAQMAQMRQAQLDMQRQFAEMAALMKQTVEMQSRSAHQRNSPPPPQAASTSHYDIPRTSPHADMTHGTPARATTGLGSNSLMVTPQPSSVDDFHQHAGYHSQPRQPSQHQHQPPSGGRYEPVDSPGDFRERSSGATHADAMANDGIGGGAQMQQRLERMRSRKKALDEMMRDLPS